MRVSSYLLLVFLAGCSQSGTDPKVTEQHATFIADPLQGSAETGQADATFSDIPVSRLINFTVCLKDVAVQESVVGAGFVVRDGDRQVALKSPVTDHKGCLYWSESFPFKATDQETYFEVVREIEATSIHRGRVSVRLGVNPWRKGSEAVRDLRFQSVPETKSVVTSEGGGAGVVVSSVSVDLDILRSKDSVAEADMRLSFSPKMYRIGLDGSQIPEPLSSGKFHVRAQLLAVLPDSILPLTPVAEFQQAPLEHGNVNVRSLVKILRAIPKKEATIELAFEALPANAPEGLRSVKGRVPLGRFESLSISRAGDLRPDPSTTFVATKGAPATVSKGTSFTFELGKVQVEEAVVKAMDQTGSPSELEVKFKVCLRNSFSHDKITDQAFAVALDGKKFPSLVTNAEDGCLRWDQRFAFDYHAKEEFLVRTLQVKSANTFYGEEEAERVVHLNFWKYDWPPSIANDELFDGKPAESVASSGSGSELVVQEGSLTFLSRTFEVDDHLNLSTLRKYQLKLSPKIQRMSRTKGWMAPQGTGNGRYRLRVLLETGDADSPQVLDGHELEVESRSNLITTEIVLRVDNLLNVVSRNRLSVEVLPLDRSSSLRTQPYASPLDLLKPSLSFAPRAGQISELIRRPRLNRALKYTGAELFARQPNRQMLDEATLKSVGASQALVDEFLFGQGTPASLKALCGLFYKPGWALSSHSRCQRDPASFLVFAKSKHVRKALKSAPQGRIDNFSISLSAGVNYSESVSESSSQTSSHGVNTNFGLGVKLGIDVGVGVSASESWSQSTSTSKSSGRSQGASSSQSLNVDHVTMGVRAELDHCLLVAEQGEEKNRKLFMACGSKPRSKILYEPYYFIYKSASDGAMVDAGSGKDRPFVSLVRGQKRYEQFVKVLEDSTMVLNVNRSSPGPAQLMREAENRYDGFFPGLLTIEE